MSAAIVAFGAVSSLGEGAAAAHAGDVGEAPRVTIARDPELAEAGLARPFAARAAVGAPGLRDRATVLLSRALAQCARGLDDARPAWRASRVGLAIGTSSGGMRSAEAMFARVAAGERVSEDEAARAAYFGPLLDAAGAMGVAFAPASLVLCACASSAIAVGLATRWLDADRCDVAIAGGFDAVATFVAAGFESLQATSARVPPRPFRAGRDGMALGEGAAVLALVRVEDAEPSRVVGYVRGFGASADAVHLTAPDRTGAGLARAALAALEDAGGPDVDLVSAHATATPFNDAAEARAIERALGDRARDVPVHAFKAQVGHTLGAAGALESLAALDAIARGVVPATAGEGAPDTGACVALVDRARRGEPRVALKLASAFGGANAALVLSREPPPPRTRTRTRTREPWITRAAHVTAMPPLESLAASLGAPLDKIARADGHVTWALAALDALATRLGSREAFAGAGIVVGTAAATLETNAVFAARLRARGARFVEPRRFPYTSPNAVAGECGVVFGLRGPSFSCGAGLHAGVEALVLAADLVRARDAPAMLVVAVDDVGDAAGAWSTSLGAPLTPGAVALLVTSEPTPASIARVTTLTLTLTATPSPTPTPSPPPPGHLALAPLASPSPPAFVSAASSLLSTLATARVDLAPI